MELPKKVYIHKSQYWGLMANKDNITKDGIEYIRKDALVKYLYEEKGYPITLNGELVHWDELTKHLAEYYNWRKNVFIEEAWNWIEDNLLSSNQQDKSLLYYEQFKNYMKGK